MRHAAAVVAAVVLAFLIGMWLPTNLYSDPVGPAYNLDEALKMCEMHYPEPGLDRDNCRGAAHDTDW